MQGLLGRPVAVVGLGQIGMSWAACFLARGLAVAATDVDPLAEHRARAYVAKAWPQLEAMGLVVPGADPDRFTFHSSIPDAVSGCGLVQENGPEVLSMKVALLEQIDAATAPDVLIASSTSALAMSDMQVRCQYPGRCFTAHPFNPPHLIPLVELVGGRATDPGSIAIAHEFYTAIGRKPVRLHREVYGHVANRLQNALFNEAARLVLEGVTTVEDIETAVNWGPGMRWPFVGPFINFHMAGGAQGMAGTFAKFGAEEATSTDRVARIQLSAEQRASLIEGVAHCQGARSVEELETMRDRMLVALYRLKHPVG